MEKAINACVCILEENMKTTAIVLLMAVIAGCAAAADPGAAPKGTPLAREEKIFVTDDSLKLWAELLRDTTTSTEPLVILLHMLGRNHESYEPFIEALQKFVEKDSLHRPLPTILNLDLRGHGASIVKAAQTLSYKTMQDAEFKKIPGDVRQFVESMLPDPTLGVDTNNIIVIGASIGANSAAILTDLMPGIKRVVLLSPGKSYHSLEPADAIAKFKGEILIYASKGDAYAAESSEFFAGLNKGHTTLWWHADDAHGTDIVNFDKEAMAKLVDWIMRK
jgi:pimeloyl-ACP methyl ester carboxylesterase